VTSVDRAELAAFLRRRRAAVSPADAGLPAGPRRRTPGLRRQEVAQLAGMSVDYYTRLEQGRGPRPSRQMLGAIGRALRLSGDELAYLHYVAGETPGPPSGPARDVRPGILALLGRLDDTPALVCDAKYDVLAWNPMAAALLTDFSRLPAAERNIAPDVLLHTRITPDMFPLIRQVQIATDMAKGAGARLAGVEPPKMEDNETTFEELQTRIATVIAQLQAYTPAQIDGSEDRTVLLKTRGGEQSFRGQDYLLGFVLPNVYFHITTAYAILRGVGVVLGKTDFIGKP